MGCNVTLSRAILAVLAGCSLEPIVAAADEASDIGLQEIVVTAERRNENMQTVPITIQALTGETLDRKSTRLNSSHSDLSRMPSSA